MRKSHIRSSASVASFLSFATLVSVSLFAPSAFAHGDEPEHTSTEGEKKPEGEGAESKEGEGQGEHKEGEAKEGEGGEKGEAEEEAEWELTGDFVVGGANTDIATNGPPGPREGATKNALDSSRVTTVSMLLGLEHPINKRWTIGARMPFMEGDISSRTGLLGARNGIYIPGNLELGVTYKLPLAGRNLELTLEFGVPTGAGVEQPSQEDIDADPTRTYQYNAIDKAAVMRASSWARGQLDSGLFEPGRIAITPKVAMPIDFGKLSIRPMLKVENLADVTGAASQGYVGELVFGARVAYRVHPNIEPGVAAWANILFTKAEESDPSIIAVNPYVRFVFPHVKPYVGAILPVFGHLWTDKAYGINFGAIVEL